MSGFKSISNAFYVSTMDDPSSVVAQYTSNPPSSPIHDTWQDGDVYMRTKQTNDSTWSDWHKVVGESGGETDYTFAISSQRANYNNVATNPPSDLNPYSAAQWSDAPVITTQQKPFLWSRVQKKDGDGNNVGSATYIRLTGEGGVTFTIISSIGSVKIGGSATSASINTTLTAYKKEGESNPVAYQCYFSIFKKKGSTYTFEKKYSTKGASVSYSNNNVTITDYDAIVVCIYDALSESHSGYLAELEIPVGKDGDDSIEYIIKTTMPSVTIPSGATTGSISTTLTFFKRIGQGAEQAYSCYIAIFRKKGSTYEKLYNSTSAITSYNYTNNNLTEANYDDIVVCMYDAQSTTHSGYLAELVIPVKKNGDPAPYYEDDYYGWSNVESVPNSTTEPTPNNGWSKSIPSQGSYAYLWKKIVGHNWNSTTQQYTNETAQYFRMSGTNGTSIKTKGNALYVATSKNNFPSGTSTDDIALEEATKKPYKWNGSSWSTSGMADAVDGDSYVISQSCTFHNKDVMGHLIMWSDEANSGRGAWIDLGQFKGDSGTTYYTHIAWAISVTFDTTTGQVSVTGFEPVKPASDTTHIWMGVLVDTNSGQDPSNASLYTWSNTKGDKGDAARSYFIRGGNDVTIAAGATQAALQASLLFYYKDANASQEYSFMCSWSVYKVSNGTYTLLSYGTSAGCNIDTTVDASVNEVCVFLFNRQYTGTSPQTQTYYTYRSIKVTKNGNDGQDSAIAYLSPDKITVRFYGNGNLVSDITKLILFSMKVGSVSVSNQDITVTAGTLPTGVSVSNTALPNVKSVTIGNSNTPPTPDGILSGITFTVSATYNGKNYSAPVTLALIPSIKGETGRFYYYAGVFDQNNDTDPFPINDAQTPYFKTGDSYHVFLPDENPQSGDMTMYEMWQATETSGNPPTRSFDNNPWRIMYSDFKYIITEAIFGQYAQFGSGIINGDWQLCTSGTVDGDDAESTDYIRFDPQFPLGDGTLSVVSADVNITSTESSYALMQQIGEDINVIQGCKYYIKVNAAKTNANTGSVSVYICSVNSSGTYTLIKSGSKNTQGTFNVESYFTANNYSIVRVMARITNENVTGKVSSITLEPSSGDSNMFVPNYALDMRTGKIYINDAVVRGTIRAAKYEYKVHNAEQDPDGALPVTADMDYYMTTPTQSNVVLPNPATCPKIRIVIVNAIKRSADSGCQLYCPDGSIVPFFAMTSGTSSYRIGRIRSVTIWSDPTDGKWHVIEKVPFTPDDDS